MARTRTFDEQQATDRAMELFWREGYGAASLDRLLAATDLSKSSLYEVFGSKRGVLLAALARYREQGMAALIAPLLQPKAGRAAIEQTFRNALDHALSAQGQRGCLINNCLVEVGAHDDEIRDAACEVLAGLEQAFFEAVRRGQQDGTIAGRDKPRALARFLVNTLSGINVAAKRQPGRAVLHDIVRVALRALD